MVAAEYLPDIDAAIMAATDGAREADLKQLAPIWFVHALAQQGIYDRQLEQRSDSKGRLARQWIWRTR